METYLNKRGNSPISYYEFGDDYITVSFKGSKKNYTYSYLGAGEAHVENMKILAISGSGLSAYITRNVSKAYD